MTIALPLVFAGLSALDLATTYQGLATHQLHEGNPISAHRPLYQQVMIQSAGVTAESWAVSRLRHDHHPTYAKVLKWGIIVGRSVVIL